MNSFSAAVVLIAVSVLAFGHSLSVPTPMQARMQARNTSELLEGLQGLRPSHFFHGMTLRDLVPSRFGEFFDIIILFFHIRWHFEILEAMDIISERFDILEDKIDRLRKESREKKEPINNNNLQQRPSYVYAPFFKSPMQSLQSTKQNSQ